MGIHADKIKRGKENASSQARRLLLQPDVLLEREDLHPFSRQQLLDPRNHRGRERPLLRHREHLPRAEGFVRAQLGADHRFVCGRFAVRRDVDICHGGCSPLVVVLRVTVDGVIAGRRDARRRVRECEKDGASAVELTQHRVSLRVQASNTSQSMVPFEYRWRTRERRGRTLIRLLAT